MTAQRWAIVGGGLLGMSLARALVAKGQKVELFEAAPELGGLAAPWQIGHVIWDRHYHVTLFSDTAVRSLLTDLQLHPEMVWRRVQTAFYHQGRLVPFNTAWDFLRFPMLSFTGKCRLAATILRASRLESGEHLSNISVQQWLTKLSGRRVFEQLWLPLLRAKLGEDYQTTSASFIWATIRRMYAARRTGNKQELFGYLPGGYARLLQVFAAYLVAQRVDIHLSAPVRLIEPNPDGGLVLRTSGAAPQRAFDQVIVTTPSPIAAGLCPAISVAEKQAFSSVQYSGVICTSVLLRKPISPYYITNIVDSRVPFTGVIEMSALVDRGEFGGSHLVYLPRYLPPDHADFDAPEEQLHSATISSLRQMHPKIQGDDIITARTSKVRYVFPRPLVQEPLRLPVSTSVPGLHFLSAAHISDGTLNANETITLASRNAESLYAASQKTSRQYLA